MIDLAIFSAWVYDPFWYSSTRVFISNWDGAAFFVFLFFFHAMIGIFGIYRMKIRKTVDNPDSQFVAMPQTITPAGIELNPQTEPFQEPKPTMESSLNLENIIDSKEEDDRKY